MSTILGEGSTEILGRTSLWIIILIGLIAASYLLIRKLRSDLNEDSQGSGMTLSSYREMHASGEISDEEFRSIKLNLMEKMQDTISNDEHSG